ncbi:MAG: hypothetical protein IKI22_03215 [Neisseriaceae bacterium]|nr:hypothetical protein [Neisseriaceae bacterium]
MYKKCLIILSLLLSVSVAFANPSKREIERAVSRVEQYIINNYTLQRIGHDLGEDVFYLGKISKSPKHKPVDAFAVDVVYSFCEGSACVARDLILSSTYTDNIEDSIEIKHNNPLNRAFDNPNYWSIRQIKAAPNPEFMVTVFEEDKGDHPNFPTLKYEQVYRFNPQQHILEPVGKRKFAGKEK